MRYLGQWVDKTVAKETCCYEHEIGHLWGTSAPAPALGRFTAKPASKKPAYFHENILKRNQVTVLRSDSVCILERKTESGPKAGVLEVGWKRIEGS